MLAKYQKNGTGTSIPDEDKKEKQKNEPCREWIRRKESKPYDMLVRQSVVYNVHSMLDMCPCYCGASYPENFKMKNGWYDWK